MNHFFTSDSHFGHGNIIKYCNRPFQTIQEMNEAMITNWNSVVSVGDWVWHLGDFALSMNQQDAISIRNRLNGNIGFIFGNHDKIAKSMKGSWQQAHSFYELKVPGYPAITLCHYAMRIWNKAHYGTWHLYGHSHGTLPDDPNSLSFDVGVDCHNFKPLSIDEVQAIMKTKTFKPVDHHNRNTT